MKHNMKLNHAPFEMIKNGQKTIELRLYDEKRKNISVGDKILFTNNSTNQIISTTVINLHIFDSFDSLYEKLPLLSCGYTTENVNEARASDMELYYSKMEQEKYGVVGIELTMDYLIREIEKKDNKAVEGVIRACLIEYGGNHEGTAWADPDLGRFSEIYNSEGNKYWVCEDKNGKIVGGTGIGYLTKEVCELQKMYCLPEVRGTGAAHTLMQTALEYAKKYYKSCYLETLDNMTRAQRFYEKYGFVRVDKPVIITEHFACEVKYLKEF